MGVRRILRRIGLRAISSAGLEGVRAAKQSANTNRTRASTTKISRTASKVSERHRLCILVTAPPSLPVNLAKATDRPLGAACMQQKHRPITRVRQLTNASGGAAAATSRFADDQHLIHRHMPRIVRTPQVYVDERPTDRDRRRARVRRSSTIGVPQATTPDRVFLAVTTFSHLLEVGR